MQLTEYAKWTFETAKYPEAGTGSLPALTYCVLGLSGESGEVVELIKKQVRGGVIDPRKRPEMREEIGDVFYYVSRLCEELGFDPEELLDENRNKLLERKNKNQIVNR